MNQSMNAIFEKAIYTFLGFGIPLILFAVFILFGWGNLPLMILSISWLGFSILFYTGLTDKEIIE